MSPRQAPCGSFSTATLIMSSEDSRPNTESAGVPTAVLETAYAGKMASVNAAVVSLDGIVLAKLVQMTAVVSLEEVNEF